MMREGRMDISTGVVRGPGTKDPDVKDLSLNA